MCNVNEIYNEGAATLHCYTSTTLSATGASPTLR